MYGFRFFFTPLFRVLFTFPSRYLFTIGHLRVFSLTRWCWLIHTRFHRPRATQDTTRLYVFALTGLSPSMVPLSNGLQIHSYAHSVVLLPQDCRNNLGLGCSLFARHYLGNHCCFLFLRILRCFSSPRLPPGKPGSRGCPIRKSSDLGLLASTRSLSQLATSFIAFKCLGILRTPFLFFFHFVARMISSYVY